MSLTGILSKRLKLAVCMVLNLQLERKLAHLARERLFHNVLFRFVVSKDSVLLMVVTYDHTAYMMC